MLWNLFVTAVQSAPYLMLLTSSSVRVPGLLVSLLFSTDSSENSTWRPPRDTLGSSLKGINDWTSFSLISPCYTIQGEGSLHQNFQEKSLVYSDWTNIDDPILTPVVNISQCDELGWVGPESSVHPQTNQEVQVSHLRCWG